MKDYQSLQQQNLKYEDIAASLHKRDHDEEPDQLVALSLGRSSLLEPKSKALKDKNSTKEEDGKFNEALALRLDGKYDSSDHSTGVLKNESSTKSFNELKEVEEPSDTWSPSKKSSRLERNGDDEEVVIQQNLSKKARVSVRAICNAPTMNDGCQWRKYGQKISKGNPCPRAYFRCRVSPSCPVRKHVQRCAEDMSILVTTYEGAHNHKLPPSATAMASTTSAAVSMLRSSSSTSQLGSLGATTSANLHELNLSTRANNSFYIPNTTTISTSQLHPTVTLDLTTPTASSHYNKYASTCLEFSAANYSSLEYWGALSNKKNLNGSSYVGLTQLPSQSVPPFYQPYYNKMPTNNTYDQPHPQQCFTEKIAAATKEITSNPSFQSALAAAIASMLEKGRPGL